MMTPAEPAEKKELTQQIAAIEKQRPKPLPMAEIATDGDYRFSPLGRGRRHHQLSEVPDPATVPAAVTVHEGPGKYEVPPSYFLIRGDPREPGLADEARLHRRRAPTASRRPRFRGPTATRRAAGSRWREWIASPQNPLTARVIVNRLWQKHFGRGIVATLENFGKMGEQPTHQELLDWLAVEFMNRGWSIKQINKLMMMSEAYQMASAFEHGGNAKVDLGEPATCGDSARSGSKPRSSATACCSVGGNINLDDRRRAGLPVHSDGHPRAGSTAGSGRTRPKVRRPGGAASTSIGGARCRIRCSIRSIIPT